MTIAIDRPTIIFLLTISIVTGVIAGSFAAFRLGRDELTGALKEGGRGSSGGPGSQRLRDALVVAEVALAAVLLVGASLLVQSFRNLQRSDPGFQADGLLTFRVEMGWRAYDSHAKVINLLDTVSTRLRALPGVDTVGIDSNLPLSGKPREPYEVTIDGQSQADRERNPFVHLHVVNPDYFTAMRSSIVRGRAFVDTDGANSQPVAVISETAAERLFPSRDPIGQRIAFGDSRVPGNWATIIGIAAPVKLQHLAASGHLDVYRPYRQTWLGGYWFMVRTRGVHPSSLANAAPPLVTQFDPDQSFFDVQVMTDRVASGIWQQRAAGALFAAFGGLAFLLSVVGLYGVLSYLVTQQRREIGVRMALGAEAGRVWSMVIGRGASLTAAGCGLGLVIAWASARAASTLLFEVSAADPVTFVLVPLGLLVTAVVACALPARRATRIDPLLALRSE
jgi:putative ABC transport system permease protein